MRSRSGPVSALALCRMQARRVRRWSALTLALTATTISAPGPARAQFTLEILAGAAWNAATPLTIRQQAEDDLHLSARYDSRSFESPPYYAWRVGAGEEARWEVQFVHHKLVLSDPPGPVQGFQITHGFNILTVNRSIAAAGLRWRLGAGLVLAHTESTVRGAVLSSGGGLFDTGYRATGPLILAGVGKEVPLSPRLFGSAEVELTAGRFEVPVAHGRATGSNLALHARVGLGYRL